MSSNVIAVDVTPPAISPTKEEVKEERIILYTIATDLECKLESSNKKIETLALKSKSLANSLKMEKLKSRSAMELLLVVITRQTEELIATFQDRFRQLKTDHKEDLHKLMRGSNLDRLDNQKYIKRLRKMYKKKMTELDSDYRIRFAQLENKHQKKIVSILSIIIHPC